MGMLNETIENMICEELKVIKQFHSESFRTNCTFIFYSGQATFFAKADVAVLTIPIFETTGLLKIL